MDFNKLLEKKKSCGARNNNTAEKTFEFEGYANIVGLLDLFDSFQNGTRNICFEPDYNELLGSLKHSYDFFVKNIRYLKFHKIERELEKLDLFGQSDFLHKKSYSDLSEICSLYHVPKKGNKNEKIINILSSRKK